MKVHPIYHLSRSIKISIVVLWDHYMPIWYFVWYCVQRKSSCKTNQRVSFRWVDFTSTKPVSVPRYIAVTSHERHGVSNHRQLDCLFLQQLVNQHQLTKDPYYWLFGNTSVDCPHKGSVMRKAYMDWLNRSTVICYLWKSTGHIEGLVQDCSNSSTLAMELLQSCTKPSI